MTATYPAPKGVTWSHNQGGTCAVAGRREVAPGDTPGPRAGDNRRMKHDIDTTERSIDDRPTAEELRARQRADDPGVNVGDYVRVTRKAHAGFTGRVVAVDEQDRIVDATGWEATIEQESGNRATFGCSLLEVLEARHAQ